MLDVVKKIMLDGIYDKELTAGVFRRNATHCISPYAIGMCVCVCVCLSVCVYATFVDDRKTV